LYVNFKPFVAVIAQLITSCYKWQPWPSAGELCSLIGSWDNLAFNV